MKISDPRFDVGSLFEGSLKKVRDRAKGLGSFKEDLRLKSLKALMP